MKAVIASEATRSRQSRRSWIASSLALLAMTIPLRIMAYAQPFSPGAQPIPDAVWSRMQGRSLRPGLACASRDDLVLLTVPYRDFAGVSRTGPLIVARRVAGQVAAIFRDLHDADALRIARMALIDEYGGDDDASLAADNTSAFNCRTVQGTTHLSDHARGLAIDINPIENPYVGAGEIAPPAGRPFATPQGRAAAAARHVPGLVVPGGPAVRIFARYGWRWGGAWRSERDYQHFYAGR